MNQFIERFLLPLFVFMSLLYAVHACGQGGIELHKVFHHKSDSGVHLELINLSMYFSHEPQVKVSSGVKGFQHIIFLPEVTIRKQECRNMIQRINQDQNIYGIKIEEVLKPVRGIQIFISFDPAKFSLSYESFDSIGLEKGVVFRLYSKELLKKIETNNRKPILKTLWHTKKPRIAIDPGHGGRDSGAVGVGGMLEKDVCLAIGKSLAQMLQNDGVDVVLTRDGDANVSLDQRTTYANGLQADLFVSIHANYAKSQSAYGIETFCLSPDLFKEQFSMLTPCDKVAAHSIFDQRTMEAKKLAQAIQHNACKVARECNKKLIDRKVKHSVAQVLLGAQMPTVIVEVGFLSNHEEAGLLNTENYQKVIAGGIYDGIISFLRS